MICGPIGESTEVIIAGLESGDGGTYGPWFWGPVSPSFGAEYGDIGEFGRDGRIIRGVAVEEHC